MITPETPAAPEHEAEHESKQLGHSVQTYRESRDV
jgi:hypothetical protein